MGPKRQLRCGLRVPASETDRPARNESRAGSFLATTGALCDRIGRGHLSARLWGHTQVRGIKQRLMIVRKLPVRAGRIDAPVHAWDDLPVCEVTLQVAVVRVEQACATLQGKSYDVLASDCRRPYLTRLFSRLRILSRPTSRTRPLRRRASINQSVNSRLRVSSSSTLPPTTSCPGPSSSHSRNCFPARVRFRPNTSKTTFASTMAHISSRSPDSVRP